MVADKFREYWGAPVIVSPVPGAVGRFGAPRSRSQHSVDYWGETRALDLFPTTLNRRSVKDWNTLLEILVKAGADGIGFYPQARAGRLRGMVHIDTRGETARWSGWRKKVGKGWVYKSISEVISPDGRLARQNLSFSKGL